MLTRQYLKEIVVEAIKANGGQSTYVQIAQYIWQHYEPKLRASGDLFFTWQYDIRWAVPTLRKSGILEKHDKNSGAKKSVIKLSKDQL